MTDSGPPSKQTVDLKWDRLVDLTRTTYPHIKIGHERILRIGHAYGRNIRRIREMILSVSRSANIGMQMQRGYDLALLEVTNGLVAPTDPKIEKQVEILGGHKFYELMELDRQAFLTNPEGWRKHFEDVLIEMGTRTVNFAARGGAGSGLSAILASCVMSSWTAFETMAADLWEEAINTHPNNLAALKGTRKKGAEKDDDDEIEDASKNSQSIGLHLLQRYHYDLRSSMGSVLRSIQRFDRLAGAREAYAQAFYKSYDDIDAALNDRCIDALNATRNLLVHRAGLVDDQYLRKCRYLNIPQAALGEEIVLDGEIVFNLVSPVIETSFKLMSAVDHWVLTER